MPIAYDPNNLLNTLIERMHLRNDAELARRLRISTGIVQKIRAGQLAVGASMLIWMQEATGISVQALRSLLGDRRAKARLSCRVPAPVPAAPDTAVTGGADHQAPGEAL